MSKRILVKSEALSEPMPVGTCLEVIGKNGDDLLMEVKAPKYVIGPDGQFTLTESSEPSTVGERRQSKVDTILGLFADCPELMDEIVEGAMRDREKVSIEKTETGFKSVKHNLTTGTEVIGSSPPCNPNLCDHNKTLDTWNIKDRE